MKTNYFTIILVLCGIQGTIAQTLMRSFYDINHSKIKEEFYVNTKGEKHGLYKYYSQYDGVLLDEAYFKNGYNNGVYKKYFDNGGRAELVSIENYVEGILNGPATYYFGESHKLISERGSYLNGNKNGAWTWLDKISDTLPDGYKYYSGTTVYKDGEVIGYDNINNYYPSGKIYFQEIKLDSGITVSKNYHPNGKIWIIKKSDKKDNYDEQNFDNNERIISETTRRHENGIRVYENKFWWPNGQLKEFTTRKMTSPEANFYEGYNQDGTKNETMIYNEKKEMERRLEVAQNLQKQKKQCSQTLRKADSLFNLNQVYYLKDASYFYENLAKDYVPGARNFRKDSSNMDYYAEVTKHAEERKIEIKKMLEADELEKIEYDFNELNYPSKLEKIDMLYDVGNKKTKREVSSWGIPSEFVSNVGKKRKIYHAFELLYQESVEKMNAAKNMNEKRIVMKDRIKLLNRIIELADMDTSEMEKALKKEEDIVKIKVILGL